MRTKILAVIATAVLGCLVINSSAIAKGHYVSGTSGAWEIKNFVAYPPYDKKMDVNIENGDQCPRYQMQLLQEDWPDTIIFHFTVTDQEVGSYKLTIGAVGFDYAVLEEGSVYINDKLVKSFRQVDWDGEGHNLKAILIIDNIQTKLGANKLTIAAFSPGYRPGAGVFYGWTYDYIKLERNFK